MTTIALETFPCLILVLFRDFSVLQRGRMMNEKKQEEAKVGKPHSSRRSNYSASAVSNDIRDVLVLVLETLTAISHVTSLGSIQMSGFDGGDISRAF